MKRAGWAATGIAVLVMVGRGMALARGSAADAESLFVSGRFDAADSVFAQVLETQPGDTLALSHRGLIALFRNRTREASRWFERAGIAGASRVRMAALQGECAYREGRFAAAARSFRTCGREAMAKKLEALGDHANRVAGPPTARLPFDQTDPLPIVALTINGHGPYLFLVDTGGGELVLDPEFADSAGAVRFGEEIGTYAGDQKRPYEHGCVDSVGLGAMTVHRVPIHILETRRISAVAMGRRVAGVLGTTLLSRFRFTLDYPAGALILERLPAGPDSAASGALEVPCWLAGDHLILARGIAGISGPLTWFLDTGLAGAAFTAPPSTLTEAGLAPTDTTSFVGQGGGGGVRVVPFRVSRLTIGPVVGTGLLGMLGPFPRSLEMVAGTRIAGIVSHAFLRPYRVRFDLSAMRIRFLPPS